MKLLVSSSFSLEFLQAPGEETFLLTSDTFTAQNNPHLGEREYIQSWHHPTKESVVCHGWCLQISYCLPSCPRWSWTAGCPIGLANIDNSLKNKKEWRKCESHSVTAGKYVLKPQVTTILKHRVKLTKLTKSWRTTSTTLLLTHRIPFLPLHNFQEMLQAPCSCLGFLFFTLKHPETHNREGAQTLRLSLGMTAECKVREGTCWHHKCRIFSH